MGANKTDNGPCFLFASIRVIRGQQTDCPRMSRMNANFCWACRKRDLDRIDLWFPRLLVFTTDDTDFTDFTDFRSRSDEDREDSSVTIRAIRGYLISSFSHDGIRLASLRFFALQTFNFCVSCANLSARKASTPIHLLRCNRRSQPV